MWDEVTMVLPKKSQCGIPKPAPWYGLMSECSLFMYSEEDRAGSARMRAARSTDVENIVIAIEVVVMSSAWQI